MKTTTAAAVLACTIAAGCGSDDAGSPHPTGDAATDGVASPAAVLKTIPELSRFADAYAAAEATGALATSGPVTILAPINDAVAAGWPAEGADSDRAVSCHVLAEWLPADALVGSSPRLAKTLAETQISIVLSDGVIVFTNGTTRVSMVGADFDASGDVIHIVDGTLPC